MSPDGGGGERRGAEKVVYLRYHSHFFNLHWIMLETGARVKVWTADSGISVPNTADSRNNNSFK